MATSNEVIVIHEVGLHARPAAIFAKTATSFTSAISVINLTRGTEPVNAKSLLRVLAAAIQKNDRLRISAEGVDEQAAVETLSRLIETDFAERE